MYPLHQSPLYKLRSKKRLANLLGLTTARLTSIASSDNYARFDVSASGDKKRAVEHPKGQLSRVHDKLLVLLARVEVPDYLHSARKGRSYVTNARSHIGSHHVAKLDIRKFFPSTTFPYVYRFFAKELRQQPDVAWLLTKLVTCDGHIPTGSPISSLLAFHVHRRLFDEIDRIAKNLEVRMTCYVDDITLSGPKATKRLLWELALIVRNHGLQAHKSRTFAPDRPKLVTGAIVLQSGIRLPNARHHVVGKALDVADADPAAASLHELQKIRGRIAEARSIDPAAASKMLHKLRSIEARVP